MTASTIIKLSNTQHKDQPIVKIDFAYNVDLIALVRQHPKSRWSRTLNCWHITKEQFDRPAFLKIFKGITSKQ